LEVESSSSKPDQSKGNKTEAMVVCSNVEGKTFETIVEKQVISVEYELQKIRRI
jgi:hypothetical protein